MEVKRGKCSFSTSMYGGNALLSSMDCAVFMESSSSFLEATVRDAFVLTIVASHNNPL